MKGLGKQESKCIGPTGEGADLFWRAMTLPESIRQDWIEQQKTLPKSLNQPLTLVGDWDAFDGLSLVDSNPPTKRGCARWQKKFDRVSKLMRELYADSAEAEFEPYRAIELDIMSCLVAFQIHALQPRHDSTGTALILAEELEGCAQRVLDIDQRMSRSTLDGSPIH
jgi:hypothetical protein